jgi:uncharacterized MAPEG superfamily protein
MTTPLYALIGFVFWSVGLVVALGSARCYQVMAGQKKSNEFPSGTQHGGDAYWRLNRAHLNCLENLPLFAAVVLVAAVTGAGSETLDMLARVFVGARVCQSLVHIASGSVMAVNIRFAFYLIQLFCLCGFACLLVI